MDDSFPRMADAQLRLDNVLQLENIFADCGPTTATASDLTDCVNDQCGALLAKSEKYCYSCFVDQRKWTTVRLSNVSLCEHNVVSATEPSFTAAKAAVAKISRKTGRDMGSKPFAIKYQGRTITIQDDGTGLISRGIRSGYGDERRRLKRYLHWTVKFYDSNWQKYWDEFIMKPEEHHHVVPLIKLGLNRDMHIDDVKAFQNSLTEDRPSGFKRQKTTSKIADRRPPRR